MSRVCGSCQTLPRSLVFVALAATVLAGCATRLQVEDRNPSHYGEVGSIRAAVISVVPFELIARGLQPRFELKDEEALDKAIAVTRQSQMQVDRATSYMLSLALGDASSPPATPASAAAQGLKDPTLPAAATAASAPGLAEITGHNAVLHYQLATALKQEVAMLNSYIRDAPRKAGYSPFIVRVQVAVRPQARYTPFDAEVDLKFGCESQAGSTCGQPIVVPLLVTDSIDAGSTSSLQRNLASLGLAIGAMKGKLGLFSNFGSRSEDTVSALGWQYDSVLNVARLGAQTLSARMNAMPSGHARFELLPRVHNITALLLVKTPPANGPKDKGRPYSWVSMEPSPRFVHARTGQVLGPSSEEKPAPDSFQVTFFGLPQRPAAVQTSPIAITGKEEPFKATLLVRGGANLGSQTYVAARLLGEKTQDVLIADDVSVAADSDNQALRLTFAGLTRAVVDGMDHEPLTLCLRPGPGVSFGHQAGHGTPGGTPGCNWNEHRVTLRGKRFFETPPKRDPVTALTSSDELRVGASGTARLSLMLRHPPELAKAPLVRISLSPGLMGGPLIFRSGQSPCAQLVQDKLELSGPCNFDVDVRGLKVPEEGGQPGVITLAAEEVLDKDKRAFKDKTIPVLALKPVVPAAKQAP